MISELSKAVSKIADALPRVKLQLLTFETDWMKDAVQSLYAEIINFLVRSLGWYEAKPWKHAWKAFKDPYKLRFQDLQDKIDEKARRMDKMANTLSQMRINEIQRALERMESTMNGKRTKAKRLCRRWLTDVQLTTGSTLRTSRVLDKISTKFELLKPRALSTIHSLPALLRASASVRQSAAGI